jgi:hypothetical protein
MTQHQTTQHPLGAIYRVSAPDGRSVNHQDIDTALEAARCHMFISKSDLDHAEVHLRAGATRHIFTYGFAETWIERISHPLEA